jgi:hypothetical protein
MPGIIQAFARTGTPVLGADEGHGAGRDLPTLAAASADVPVSVGVSVALLDRAVHATLEPGTPTPAARLDLVRRITDAGLPCGVMVAPVLPLLTDSDEALDALLARIAAAGATGRACWRCTCGPAPASGSWPGWSASTPTRRALRRLYRRGAYVRPSTGGHWPPGRAAAAPPRPPPRLGADRPRRAADPDGAVPEAEQLALL